MAKWENNRTSNRIRVLHKSITKQILKKGFDVWVSYAKKTKSRYFEFFMGRHRVTIRLSDHISKWAEEFDYDIWVNTPRYNAWSYDDWLRDFEGRIAAIREQNNLTKLNKFEEFGNG